MTRKLFGFVALISILTGCAASGPLPEPTSKGSVVDFANSLVSSTTAGTLDRLLDTVKDGQADGFRWLEGWWCPRHPEVGNADDVRRELIKVCEENGGIYEMRGFCRDNADTDSVLFLAQVSAPKKCSGGPSAALTIIEPTGGAYKEDYIARLRQSGYETATEHEARVATLRKKQEENVVVAHQRREEREGEIGARRLAAQKFPIGTKICRYGAFRYTVVGGSVAGSTITAERESDGWLIGQLDGFSPDKEKVRIRVLRHDIPERDNQPIPMVGDPLMGEFSATPGAVYWDDPGNWESCE